MSTTTLAAHRCWSSCCHGSVNRATIVPVGWYGFLGWDGFWCSWPKNALGEWKIGHCMDPEWPSQPKLPFLGFPDPMGSHGRALGFPGLPVLTWVLLCYPGFYWAGNGFKIRWKCKKTAKYVTLAFYGTKWLSQIRIAVCDRSKIRWK